MSLTVLKSRSEIADALKRMPCVSFDIDLGSLQRLRFEYEPGHVYRYEMRFAYGVSGYPSIREAITSVVGEPTYQDLMTAVEFAKSPIAGPDGELLVALKSDFAQKVTFIVLHLAKGTQGTNLYIKEFGIKDRLENTKLLTEICERTIDMAA